MTRRRHRGRCTLIVLALWPVLAIAQPQRVGFDSLDADAGGAAVRLSADWFPAAHAPAPAAVLLHGCGGAYDSRGRLGERMRDYAALLTRRVSMRSSSIRSGRAANARSAPSAPARAASRR